MANKLEDLTITKVAFVPEGDNKKANVLLFKSKDGAGETPPENAGPDSGKLPETKKGVIDVKIDKSKMTPDEQATLAEFEKKYGITEPDAPAADTGGGGMAKGAEQTAKDAGAAPDLHPEVKKALDDNKALTAQVEELKKSLEIKDLTAVAKKYEVLGKKPEELAPKLYGLQKAGGTAYDDYVALLDEHLAMVEKSGIFSEVGKRGTGEANAWAAIEKHAEAIQKAAPALTWNQAVDKACQQHPELVHEYEKNR